MFYSFLTINALYAFNFSVLETHGLRKYNLLYPKVPPYSLNNTLWYLSIENYIFVKHLFHNYIYFSSCIYSFLRVPSL